MRRTLGLSSSVALIVCTVIGQGIFLKTRSMLCEAGTGLNMLAAWVGAGVLTFMFTMVLAELGAMLPDMGGTYAYLKRAYGKPMSVTYGLVMLFFGGPAAVGALAIGTAIFVNSLTGGGLEFLGIRARIFGQSLVVSGVSIFAACCILLVVYLTTRGLVLNSRVVTTTAILKVLVLIGVVLIAIAFSHRNISVFMTSASGRCIGIAGASQGGWLGFSAALIGALYAYEGGSGVAAMFGEVRSPGKTIPAALLFGTSIVIALYLAANIAYILVLGPSAIANIDPRISVVAVVVTQTLGPALVWISSAVLALSAFASLHAILLANARITAVLATDFKPITFLSTLNRNGVPARASIANGASAIVAALAGSFEFLSSYYVTIVWAFAAAISVAVIVLRHREPNLHRPYRVAAYPILPIIVAGSAVILVLAAVRQAPFQGAAAFTIISIPMLAGAFWTMRFKGSH